MKPLLAFSQKCLRISIPIAVIFHFLRAYIEPGFTSFFLKVLISALVGSVLVFRYVWTKIKPFVNFRSARKRSNEEEPDELES
jgi:hypothetical protein